MMAFAEEPRLPPLWRLGEPTEALGRWLDRGGILAIPTESSYALGADPRNRIGVATIYRVKGREAVKAMPVVAADLEQVASLGINADLPILTRMLGRRPGEDTPWPGAVSLVFPLAEPMPASAGEATLAVRVPGHDGLLRLLSELGRPLTATSANPSGGQPVLDPEAARRWLAGHDAVVVDGGRLPGGAPSTMVEITARGNRLLRRGRVPVEGLERVLGPIERGWNG